jgi:hypothetical protein
MSTTAAVFPLHGPIDQSKYRNRSPNSYPSPAAHVQKRSNNNNTSSSSQSKSYCLSEELQSQETRYLIASYFIRGMIPVILYGMIKMVY